MFSSMVAAGMDGAVYYHAANISLLSRAAASVFSPGSGPWPMLIPKSCSGSDWSALAGAGQAGFSSPAGSSALRKVARLRCITCHLCCHLEQVFDWPFTDDDGLRLSFGTSSHSSTLGSCISFAVGCRLPSTSAV